MNKKKPIITIDMPKIRTNDILFSWLLRENVERKIRYNIRKTEINSIIIKLREVLFLISKSFFTGIKYFP